MKDYPKDKCPLKCMEKMIAKERKEHPTLSFGTVKTIVSDHLRKRR